MGQSAEMKPLLPPPPDPILTLDDLPAPASVVASAAPIDDEPITLKPKWHPPGDAVTVSGLHKAIEDALRTEQHGTPKVMSAFDVSDEPAVERIASTLAMPPLDGGTVSGSIETANTEAATMPELAEPLPPPPIDALAETTERPRAVPAAAPIDATGETHDAIPEQRDRVYSDQIAAQRGLLPIAAPYVRAPMRSSRKWLYASIAFSLASLGVAASVVIWARGEVAQARSAQPAQPGEPVAARIVDEPAEPETTGVAVEAKVVEASECSVRVATHVKDARVWIDGKARGKAPATIPVACGQAALVEVRHPRYAELERTVTPQAGTLEVDARLEREKTKLTVWSEPAGAMVTYNGEVIGKTPLVTSVNRYEAGTLWFHHPDRASDWRKIVPKAGAKTVSISLPPKS